MPRALSSQASLPWWRIWVQLSEHHGIHVPIRAEVQGWRPVLSRAAGVACPVARAAIRVPVGHCRERTFSLGLRLVPGRVLTGLPEATEILFSPTHHPAPHQGGLPSFRQQQPQNMSASALLGMGVTERKQSWPCPGGAPRVVSSRSCRQPGSGQHVTSFDRYCTGAVGAETGLTQLGGQGRLPGGKGSQS